MKNCPQCGTQNADETLVCTQCGRPFAPQPPAAPAATGPAAPLAALPIGLETLVVVAVFAVGAFVLLILLITSLVGDDTSRNILIIRSITTSLLDLYVFGLALCGSSYLLVKGLDLTRPGGSMTPLARWLLIFITAYLLYLPASLAVSRILRFVLDRGAEPAYLVEQFLEGILFLAAAAFVFWRVVLQGRLPGARA